MSESLRDRLQDANPRVRKQAIVEIARSQDAGLLVQLECLAISDPSQDVRREAASTIGRLARRHPQAFGILFKLSEHPDPGVVIQAARGLVSIKQAEGDRVPVELELDRLAQHPNEVVRDFVTTERAREHAQSLRPQTVEIGGGGG